MSVELARRDFAVVDDLLSVQTKTECISTQDIGIGVICTGYASFKRVYRNTYFGRLVAADRRQEYLDIAAKCFEPTVAAAWGTWAATPGEFLVKSGAAASAGAIALGICAVKGGVQFEVAHEGNWTEWQRI